MPVTDYERYIRTAELLSGSPVVAITLNPEGSSPEYFAEALGTFRKQFGLLVTDVIADGTAALTGVVKSAVRGSMGAGG